MISNQKTCSKVNLVYWVKMARDLLTNSSVEIFLFLADHLIVTTKEQKNLDTNKTKSLRFFYELV